MFSGKNSVFGGKAPRSIPEKISRANVPAKNRMGFLPDKA